MNKQALQDKAALIRQHIIREVYHAGSGHPGGSLSATDIMTVLYFHEMNIDGNDPSNPNRDRFVLSKGHASPVLYACLAEAGFFPKEDLVTFRKLGSCLQGHPSMLKLCGVEMSTGSLGQGFSASVGMALAGRLDGRDSRIYVMLGDGELQEGITWEASMAAAHYGLDNLCAIVDHNGLQIDGKNDDVMRVMPIAEKFRAFGWNVIELDGHDLDAIAAGFRKAGKHKGAPTVLVAETHKGKGVSFMEDQAGWHGKAPDREQAEQAMAELGGIL
ncbi:MAG: transketolase [Bacillota bacterium]|nr:transketolase [Eubacteriales bacterium]MDI9492758.1 transketolase [Bacillota bacterium]NLV70614.1 transketolase [Clostridiales bacterium]HPF18790.1 transketolase [Bacillota bacterium]HRV33079.1 transketolase [Anaerovoracaceae bacterium]